MARKRYTAEEIIGPLRTSEIETGKGVGIAEVCRKLGDHGTELRNELLNGEPFYTLQEARVIVEGWRQRTARIVRWGIGHPPQRLVSSHRAACRHEGT